MDQKHAKNIEVLLIFLGGPMGPIHPVWGHVLVSFPFLFFSMAILDAISQGSVGMSG